MCRGCDAWFEAQHDLRLDTPRDPASLVTLCVAILCRKAHAVLRTDIKSLRFRVSSGQQFVCAVDLLLSGVPSAAATICERVLELEAQHIRLCAAGHLYAAKLRTDYDYGLPDTQVPVRCEMWSRRTHEYKVTTPFELVFGAEEESGYPTQLAVEMCNTHAKQTYQYREELANKKNRRKKPRFTDE